MTMRLSGKVALITGAGSGIGKAMALLFAREGATVVVADKMGDAAEETAGQIRAAGGEAIASHTDVTDSGQVQEMMGRTVSTYGGLDILINNAGIGCVPKTIIDLTEEEWDRIIAGDLTSVFLGCKYAIPEMIRQGGGAIINMSSISGLVGQRLRMGGAYNAAKGGVQLLTKSLALDFAQYNIRVNAICPAWIGTKMTQEYIDELSPTERDAVIGLHPLGRIGTPEDVAQAALFLASDEAAWVTGASFVVDGGYMAGKE